MTRKCGKLNDWIRSEVKMLINSFYPEIWPLRIKTWLDTRLPQLLTGGHGQGWRKSLRNLGGSSELKKLINALRLIATL